MFTVLKTLRSSPSLTPTGGFKSQLSIQPLQSGPAIPWRRSNVKHTSNELYVDIVETLSVILAPSGRPLSAFANGSILFTAKISGVPDLILNLSIPSGKHTIDRVLELPTFHPCVRLARWKEHPGELSFVPPDGKFLLAGYEVNLLPTNDWTSKTASRNLTLPVTIEVLPSLGPVGLDFEIRLILSAQALSSTSTTQTSNPRPHLGTSSRLGSGRSTPSFFSTGSTSSAPTLQEVVVTIPIPAIVRNILDLRASRGEAVFSTTDHEIEWRLSTKEAASGGHANLRCTVVGPLSENTDIDAAAGMLDSNTSNGTYTDDSESAYQSGSASASVSQTLSKSTTTSKETHQHHYREQNKHLMPTSAAVSFSVKGWLASGLKVESLVVDTRKSRGLGEGVKPVKGAKYLTVSKKGVETRC
jgi:AP-3 complex subunit mu